MRPVDADSLIEGIQDIINDCTSHGVGENISAYEYVIGRIKAEPTVDTAKHAEWLINSDGYYPYCSNCREVPKGGMSDYCPKCGFRMKK